MKRTQTKQIHVGPVAIGGGAPVAVQSMCNTHTSDARATIEQITRRHARLAHPGRGRHPL